MDDSILQFVRGNDSQSLKDIALTSGFTHKRVRQHIWPLLLAQANQADAGTDAPPDAPPERLPKDIDKQIVLDAERAFHFRECQKWSESERRRRVIHLGSCLHSVFSQSPHLHYYQGAHDIASVCLLQCSYPAAVRVARGIFEGPMRHAAMSNMDVPLALIDMLEALLSKCAPDVADRLTAMSIRAHFVLSWLITWFAHVFQQDSIVARIFDFLIPSHPVMAVYVAAAFIQSRQAQILACSDEYSDMYMLLQNIPKSFEDDTRAGLANVTTCLERARQLHVQFPPHSLPIAAPSAEKLREQWPAVFTLPKLRTHGKFPVKFVLALTVVCIGIAIAQFVATRPDVLPKAVILFKQHAMAAEGQITRVIGRMGGLLAGLWSDPADNNGAG